MSQFFVLIVIQILFPLITAGSFTKVVNVFQESITIKQGDVLQCEITKTDLEETGNDYHVYTQACTSAEMCYIYHPVSEKCFSFKVRSSHFPCMILSTAPYYVPNDRPEILFDVDKQYSAIRDTFGSSTGHVSTYDQSGIVNDREYRGFWISWRDEELLEVGRENETVPFLHYRYSRKLKYNYVGILTWTTRGAWIIDRVPKCPSSASNGTEVQQHIKTESDCMILT